MAGGISLVDLQWPALGGNMVDTKFSMRRICTAAAAAAAAAAAQDPRTKNERKR